jgi:hypothetical protein
LKAKETNLNVRTALILLEELQELRSISVHPFAPFFAIRRGKLSCETASQQYPAFFESLPDAADLADTLLVIDCARSVS